MSKWQHAVLWLGLLLIAFRMLALKQWTLLWSTVDKPQTKAGDTGSTQGSSGNYVPPATESGGTGLAV